MVLKVVQIPPEHIRAVWGLVCDQLEGIVERSHGRWSSATLLHAFEESDKSLWVVVDMDSRAVRAVAFTTIIEWPTGMRTISVEAGAGEGREDWQDMLLDEIEAYAQHMGCAGSASWTRKGWERSLRHRMTATHVLLERWF